MILILGTARSGTSLVAGVLHNLGLKLCNTCSDITEWNQKGNFVDIDLHQLLLLSHVKGSIDTEKFNAITKNLQAIKDHAILPYLSALPLDITHVIYTTRNIDESVESLAARRVGNNKDAARKFIEENQSHIDQYLKNYAGKILTINYDSSSNPTEYVQTIADFVGLSSTKQAIDFVSPELRRFKQPAKIDFNQIIFAQSKGGGDGTSCLEAIDSSLPFIETVTVGPDDIWYRVTPPDDGDYCLTITATSDAGVTIYSDCDGTIVDAIGYDTGTYSSTIALESGEAYYILIEDNNDAEDVEVTVGLVAGECEIESLVCSSVLPIFDTVYLKAVITDCACTVTTPRTMNKISTTYSQTWTDGCGPHNKEVALTCSGDVWTSVLNVANYTSEPLYYCYIQTPTVEMYALPGGHYRWVCTGQVGIYNNGCLDCIGIDFTWIIETTPP